MTLSANDRWIKHIPDGIVQNFTYDFPVAASTEILVFVNGVQVTTGFTINTALSRVEFAIAPAVADVRVDIISEQTLTQLVAYSNRRNSLNLEQLETQLDKLTKAAQELRRDVDRAFKAEYGEDGGSIEIADEGHFLKFDADGNLVDGGDADDIANAQEYAEDTKIYHDDTLTTFNALLSAIASAGAELIPAQSADGLTDTWPLALTVQSEADIELYVDFVRQVQDNYTVIDDGDSVQLAFTPDENQIVYAVKAGFSLSIGYPGAKGVELLKSETVADILAVIGNAQLTAAGLMEVEAPVAVNDPAQASQNRAIVNGLLVSYPGRRIRFPVGDIYFSTALDPITANNTWLVGQGDFSNGTRFVFLNVTGDDVNITGQHCGVENIWFRTTAKKTSGFSIAASGGAYVPTFRDVRIDYGWNGVLITGATESVIEGVSCRYMRGTHDFLITGAVGAASYRAIIYDWQSDNPYPHSELTAAKYKGDWTGSTAYVAGDVVLNDGKVWQCTQAGTSGGGAGPAGYPGTTAADSFSVAVSEGGCLWKFVQRSDHAQIVQDSYGYSLVVDHASLLNAAYGLVMRDTANTGTSRPIWCFGQNVEVDHALFNGVELDAGEGHYLLQSWLGSTAAGNGYHVGANFAGEYYLGGASRVMGNAQHGVLIDAGAVDGIIDGNFIGKNSVEASGTYHGIRVAAGAVRYSITNNRIGGLVGGGAEGQGYGVSIAAGASDNYQVCGNTFFGNVTGALFDGGTGTNKRVEGNIGAPTAWNAQHQVLKGPAGQVAHVWPDWTASTFRYKFGSAPSSESDGTAFA